ncbi:MAG: cellulose binding domain-containing protein, partial [Polyangiaceae bacterium]
VDPKQSNRERFSAHSKIEPCASCHRLLDPIGFAFEGFDGVGRFAGAPDTTGQIVESPHTNANFDGPLELGRILAASPDVERCVATEWFRFASGMQENTELSCLLDEVARSFNTSGASLRDLFLALTQTTHFRVRRGNPDGSTSIPGVDGGVVTPPPPPADAGTVPDAGTPPPPTGDLTVTRKTDSQWDKGYCEAVTVTNKGSAAIEWVIVLPIEGTINQIWNATATGATGQVTFRGVDFNRRVEASQSASFGFCAMR